MLLASAPGFGIELFNVLGIFPTDDGMFCVWQESPIGSGTHTEEQFEDVWEAVDAFLRERDRRKLGLDYPAAEMMAVPENRWS